MYSQFTIHSRSSLRLGFHMSRLRQMTKLMVNYLQTERQTDRQTEQTDTIYKNMQIVSFS